MTNYIQNALNNLQKEANKLTYRIEWLIEKQGDLSTREQSLAQTRRAVLADADEITNERLDKEKQLAFINKQIESIKRESGLEVLEKIPSEKATV